ncbi:MAG: SDR family NAD(P)-dependent oxidoreductase [Clostridiales bacterium]|jgi:rhamnose utilization protein RhaD (predicted bifunctional aldolase and dehydrogenase)/NAD(P)-dependent dehydrogenase (short-subunit alcohol dehydrogenase family)|nr:SDR family NAD(P)-dependent oxidoreductase [Clostridiales bacterium]
MSLAEITNMSRYYGSNPEFVLAGGGNTSFKDADYLYIKGSGSSLANMTEEGFVKMNRAKLKAMFEKKYSEDGVKREAEVLEDMMDAREKTELSKRPSVETLLHNLFNYSYVVHTHPSMVNGLTCAKDGKKIAAELFGDKVIWIDFMEPGYILATAVKKAMDTYRSATGKDANMILLQNHGLFIAGNSEAEIKEKTDYIFGAIKARLKSQPDLTEAEFDRDRAVLLAPAIRMLLRDGGTSVLVFKANKEVKKLVKSKENFYPVSSAYSPDHIVYCRHEPLFVQEASDLDAQYELIQKGIAQYKEKNGFAPRVVAVQNLGVFAWGTGKKNADICMEVFMDSVKISVYNESFGGPLFMSKYFIDFILNWEVESYRQKVSLGGNVSKRLDEKISIVTGSAQGFGQGIADEMLKQGANVVIADLNYELALENSKNSNAAYGSGKTIAIKVDVGNEETVKNMVYETVLHYGGLDILVSNAGVAIAGGLEEMTFDKFEFVTKINYSAFFLCTKYASRIMKIQNRFDPKYMADIIQINSKSGLSGSNKNFAYAGGKFGGIGLTQSFALELVPYNIKVNAICPGNLLGGPLWTDPVKGLFVQYFKAGKVPGAKSVEDVKKYYESKVPMNRGCEIIDVARAIFYIVEQEYETGQAVPVTGGQNMLR